MIRRSLSSASETDVALTRPWKTVDSLQDQGRISVSFHAGNIKKKNLRRNTVLIFQCGLPALTGIVVTSYPGLDLSRVCYRS